MSMHDARVARVGTTRVMSLESTDHISITLYKDMLGSLWRVEVIRAFFFLDFLLLLMFDLHDRITMLLTVFRSFFAGCAVAKNPPQTLPS